MLIKSDSDKSQNLLDIGAYKGDWSECAALLLSRNKIPGHVHAFEPNSSAFAFLSERFKGNNLVSINKLALSNRSGESEFFVVGELVGTDSLFSIDGATVEHVPTIRLDDFVDERRIDHVLFAKSDTEGHDLNVMQGAAKILRQGRVDVWQFEYNHRWIHGRSFLKDVFDFIADKPYQIGKLYGNGIEIYESWHPELDRFFESNYVLVLKGSRFEKLCTRVFFNYRNVLMPA